MESDRTAAVRALFAAYRDDDRAAAEALLAGDFTFHSPADPELDRAVYFERCWPNAGRVAAFDLVRVVEHADEVVVTYVATRADGTRFRNTEVTTFRGDEIARQEVYFGWDLPPSAAA